MLRPFASKGERAFARGCANGFQDQTKQRLASAPRRGILRRGRSGAHGSDTSKPGAAQPVMTVAIGLTAGGIITIALIVAILILAAGALWRQRRRKRLQAKQQAALLKAVEKSVRPSRWPWIRGT